MEAIFSIIGIFLFIALIRVALTALGSGIRAGVRAAQGKGSFSSNFSASFVGMQPMEIRLRKERVTQPKHSFDVIKVEVKGLLPVSRTTQLIMAASILDITEKDAEGKQQRQPVLCFLDQFQEKETTCYQDLAQFGSVEPSSGFVDWQPVMTVIPETLTAPRRGNRQMRVFVNAFDADSPVSFRLGFVEHGDPLASYAHDFHWNFTEVGYLEQSENKRIAEELTVQAAMSIAFADGGIAETEGKVIKNWIARRLEVLSGSEREEHKSRLNNALKRSYELAKQSQLDLAAIIDRLANVADNAGKMDAIELCLDVMSADGHADQKELEKINRIAHQLKIDLQRFGDLKDKRLSGLSTTLQTTTDYRALLNIDPNWNKDQVKAHLNKLYSQWNSRAESLEDSEKRSHAEKMLEIIASARKTLVE